MRKLFIFLLVIDHKKVPISGQQPCGSCENRRYPICKDLVTPVNSQASDKPCCEDASYPECDDGKPTIPFNNPESFECISQDCQGRVAKIAARNAQTVSKKTVD